MRNKFFVHKAESFWKQPESRSKSPVKGVLSNIQNSSRKIRLLKLNSVAFKKKVDSKTNEWADETNEDQNSPISNGSEEKSKQKSSKNIERMIISPIKWERVDRAENDWGII